MIINNFVIQLAIFLLGKVKYFIPFVRFCSSYAVVIGEVAYYVSQCGVGKQLWVFKIIWSKAQVGGALDYRIIRCIHKYTRVYQISTSELATADSDLTLLTISEENGCLYRPDVELGVLASIDGDLGSMIKEDDGAVFQILYHEVDSVDVSRHFDQLCVFL